MDFFVISYIDERIWYSSNNYSDCVEYLHNCLDVAEENDLRIVAKNYTDDGWTFTEV